jgi:hypothetical protein
MVAAGSLRGTRLDALSWRPAATRSGGGVRITRLGHVVTMGGTRVRPLADASDLVPYVGLPECSQTRIREIAWRPYKEVRGRHAFSVGDILFARIEPSVFNRKYVWVEQLEVVESAYTSGEFYVLTPDVEAVDPFYLYAVLFTSYFYSQLDGKMTGSSGRRRLERPLLESMEIPTPSLPVQREIASEVRGRQRQATELRIGADADWRAAKRAFEVHLLAEGQAE